MLLLVDKWYIQLILCMKHIHSITALSISSTIMSYKTEILLAHKYFSVNNLKIYQCVELIELLHTRVSMAAVIEVQFYQPWLKDSLGHVVS